MGNEWDGATDPTFIKITPKELQIRLAAVEVFSLLGDLDDLPHSTIKTALRDIGKRLDRAIGQNNDDEWERRGQ